MRYPVFLEMKGRKAVVFGAGCVALRKIKSLLKSGARVEVLSREFSAAVKKLARNNARVKLKSLARPHGALQGADLAMVATSDPAWNRRVAALCRRKKIWVNVADDPAQCDFFVPSYFKKGKLELAISTGGQSPALAKRLRKELSKRLRPEALRLITQLGRARRTVQKKFSLSSKRQNFLEAQIGKSFRFFS